MHIPDGILPLPVTIGGYAACACLTWGCLRVIERRADPRADIPKAALLTAAFFISSLIHLPVPPASVHLVLNGLLGVLLGPFAVPAILIGLFFQAVMFGHGGLTTLGVNGLILALPALLAAGLLRPYSRKAHASVRGIVVRGGLAAAAATALSVLLFVGFVALAMPAHLDGAAERSALLVLLLAHIPLVVLEGVVTGALVLVLVRSAPNLLHGL